MSLYKTNLLEGSLITAALFIVGACAVNDAGSNVKSVRAADSYVKFVSAEVTVSRTPSADGKSNVVTSRFNLANLARLYNSKNSKSGFGLNESSRPDLCSLTLNLVYEVNLQEVNGSYPGSNPAFCSGGVYTVVLMLPVNQSILFQASVTSSDGVLIAHGKATLDENDTSLYISLILETHIEVSPSPTSTPGVCDVPSPTTNLDRTVIINAGLALTSSCSRPPTLTPTQTPSSSPTQSTIQTSGSEGSSSCIAIWTDGGAMAEGNTTFLESLQNPELLWYRRYLTCHASSFMSSTQVACDQSPYWGKVTLPSADDTLPKDYLKPGTSPNGDATTTRYVGNGNNIFGLNIIDPSQSLWTMRTNEFNLRWIVLLSNVARISGNGTVLAPSDPGGEGTKLLNGAAIGAIVKYSDRYWVVMGNKIGTTGLPGTELILRTPESTRAFNPTNYDAGSYSVTGQCESSPFRPGPHDEG